MEIKSTRFKTQDFSKGKKKNTKISVAYEDMPKELKNNYPYDGMGVICKTCVFFEKDKKCSVVQGEIEESGCCTLYSWEGRVNLDFISGKEAESKILSKPKEKLTKIEAGYLKILPKDKRSPFGKDQASFGCHSCYYYKNKSCGIVQGIISPYACCNLWSYHKIKKGELGYSSGKKINLGEDFIEIL